MDGTWLSIQIFNYVLINKFLGKGALAIVYRGYLQEDKTFQMAIKTIKIATILQNQRMVAQIRREIIILQKLDHPNIVKIFDVARTNNYLYIVLEYCVNIDLNYYMAIRKSIDLANLKLFF
ncbi:unnamed protein product [Paramecium sonneborni]|uniref:Protein kinase domain-containing protein n=1 Tax=Paramecium sonneborni TaxID=65129 RepID=A0A8S1Q7R9_9CILI|nr:unnamed protein product [Paramecium sonneborni]